MQIQHLNAGLACFFMLAASGCIDKNYDLSDIDTTTEVKVTDLTVPINLDKITLDDIFSINEGSQIKTVADINGNEFYAFTESGSFSSSPIYVEKVKAAAPTLETKQSTIHASSAESSLRAKAAAQSVCYDITSIPNNYSFNATNIDNSITDISSAKTEPVTFAVTLEAKNTALIAASSTFSKIQIQLLKGLNATSLDGSYDAKTGIWSISEYTTSASSATFKITVNEFDFKTNDASFDSTQHTLSIPGEFSIISGLLTITPKQEHSNSLPSTLDFEARYKLNDLVINSFSGRLHYQLEGLDISPITISNIPDFLDNEDTNLILANPQIYISTNNPVANEKLSCQAGLTLTAMRPSIDSMPDFAYSADSPITINYNNGISGPYNFVLAPTPTASSINILDSKYSSDLNGIVFTDLKNILAVPSNYSGAKLPEKIAIELTNPEIVEGNVSDFALGRNIDGIKGSYEFVAPLALCNGSHIVYTKTNTGWNDEDVDALTITQLKVTANVTNNSPLAAELEAFPIDTSGNRIDGVTISSVTVDADAIDAPITITMSGTIKHLDGITYKATIKSDSESTLSQDQTITLTNIKVTATGSYIKEL
jgi:hypothetical protein